MILDTQNAQISQKQGRRNIYVIMKKKTAKKTTKNTKKTYFTSSKLF